MDMEADMAIYGTLLVCLFLISVTIFFKREDWFPSKKKVVLTPYRPVASAAPPATQPAKSKEEMVVNISFGWLFLCVALLATIGAIYWWANRHPAKTTRVVLSDQQFARGMESILSEICLAESGGRQFEDGNSKTPLKGKEDPDDTGICQINKRIWKDEIAKTGIDIESSAEGNKLFAKHLYMQYGVGPWLKSMHRWGPKIGEPVWGKFFLTAKKWVEFDLPKAGGHTTTDGGGERYILRYNGEIEEEMPRVAGALSKRPTLVTSIGFKSKEEDMMMTIVFSPLVPTTTAAAR